MSNIRPVRGLAHSSAPVPANLALATDLFPTLVARNSDCSRPTARELVACTRREPLRMFRYDWLLRYSLSFHAVAQSVAQHQRVSSFIAYFG
jgi:hypothetical protein